MREVAHFCLVGQVGLDLYFRHAKIVLMMRFLSVKKLSLVYGISIAQGNGFAIKLVVKTISMLMKVRECYFLDISLSINWRAFLRQ